MPCFTCRVLPVDNPFKKPSAKVEKDSVSETPGPSKSDSKTSKAGEKRKSALDEIMEFEERKKEKMNRKDYWLHKDIVVKVVSKKLGDKYYKQKAYVKVCRIFSPIFIIESELLGSEFILMLSLPAAIVFTFAIRADHSQSAHPCSIIIIYTDGYSVSKFSDDHTYK